MFTTRLIEELISASSRSLSNGGNWGVLLPSAPFERTAAVRALCGMADPAQLRTFEADRYSASTNLKRQALMNGSQVFVALFAIVMAAISLWSVIAVIRSPALTLKPLWVIGCLFVFIGFGIDWTTPDDVIILFGITIPMVMVF